MKITQTLLTAAVFAGLALSAQAQGYKPPDRGYNSGQEFNDNPGYNQRQAPAPSQGFNLPNDRIAPSYDRRPSNRYDERYSQTYQQQQQEAQRPGGGCLRYGAVGAAGGHLAGHGVLGAVAGCIVGRVVRNRDRARIEAQQQGAPR